MTQNGQSDPNMECEEFIFSDWSPPDNPIQSERASSSIMECEEFILPDWSPFDDPARVLAAEGRRNPSSQNFHKLFFLTDSLPECNLAKCVSIGKRE